MAVTWAPHLHFRLEEHAPKYCCEEEGCYLLFSMDFLASDNKALAQIQLVNTSWF